MEQLSIRDQLRREANADYEELEKEIEKSVNDGFAELLPLRLHISNIPFCFTEDHLKQLFGKFGPVIDAEIISNQRGSKGFGFVTMKKKCDAERASKVLHGSFIKGRQIEVNLATPRKFTAKSPSKLNIHSPNYVSSPSSVSSSAFNFNHILQSPQALPSPIFFTTNCSTPATPGPFQTIQNFFIFSPK